MTVVPSPSLPGGAAPAVPPPGGPDSPAASGGGRLRPARRGSRSQRYRGWLFIAPLLAINLLVIVGPSAATIWYSFTDWSGLGPAEFVGFDNYTRAVSDPSFHRALLHNVIWLGIFLTVPLAMGLLGAHLLSQIKRYQIFFRTIFFIPYVVASVVNAFIWQNLLSPSSGIGQALDRAGIPFLRDVSFFGDPDLALGSVAFVSNWHWWGFVAVIFLAAMQSVDTELYDAAKVDGANRWQQFRSVTFPGIRPTFVFLALMTVIWSLKVFDYVYIITQGGPAGATEVVATLMYKAAFSQFEAGYAAALGLGMSFVSGVVIAGYLWLRKRGWEE